MNKPDDTVIDTLRMRRAFERAAPSYDSAAVLQREVGERMLERLDYVKLAPRRILDAGSGTGHALAPLARRFPQAHLVALDLALGMLVQGRPQVGPLGRLLHLRGDATGRVCADVASLPFASGTFQLIWSNLTLQWCNDLPAVFGQWHAALATEGLLMFSTFGPDTLKELRASFQAVDGYTHVSRFVDMHDIGDMLVHAGFADPVMDMEMITQAYTDLSQVLHDLKSIGAHNATAGRPRGLMGKARWQRMAQAYERLRREGRLPATFEVVYGHAWKPQPRATPEGHAIVRFVK